MHVLLDEGVESRVRTSMLRIRFGILADGFADEEFAGANDDGRLCGE